MLKTLIVWFVVMFLRKFGRNVDRKEIARLKKVYSQHGGARIERRIDSMPQSKTAKGMLPGAQPVLAGVGAQRVSLYNKNGNLIRLNMGVEPKQFSTI
ncbi:hypothetical protein [Candidatus Magnetaquicoccus inordinatus]|uniref:hypothetical protein n=1 Tax=Candidatus Magnetaquicoccus inordinatus TaxID=2496818 RepID=UPI00102AC830|nr:hypothetical protein [Candidatus Magnetaquicoccus inordinatus]